MKAVFCAAFLCLVVARCNGIQNKSEKESSLHFDNTVNQERNHIEDSLVQKMNTKCSQNDISSCVMLKLVTYMNRMLKKTAIQVGDDVEITANSAVNFPEEPLQSESARTDIPDDDQMTNLLIEKAWTFIKSRSLRWQMIEGAELVIAGKPDGNGSLNIDMSVKSGESGRGKNKNLAPILAAAAMKIALLGGLAFKGLVLLVGKALLVSKIALLLASIIGLKKLFSTEKHVTYEVVSHPHHSQEISGHEAFPAWGHQSGRSDQVQELAYSQQFPGNIEKEEVNKDKKV